MPAIFPGQLAEHGLAEGAKAVSKAKGDPKGANDKLMLDLAVVHESTLSSRAGLSHAPNSSPCSQPGQQC